MQIIQIVPRLPPVVDGVGDYAYQLAKRLRAEHDINTVFVVCDPRWKPENKNQKSEIRPLISNFRPLALLDGFPIYQLKEQSAEELERVLSQMGMPATALLQYVGYGYSQRGCPAWLMHGLRKWKRMQSSENSLTIVRRPPFGSRILLTMFHELYASGPLWSSAFWTSSAQKWITKSLARLSGHIFTNLKIHAGVLQQFLTKGESQIMVLPVFSNVGEPDDLPAWHERAPRMIVFGSAGWRHEVYHDSRFELEKVCLAMGLNEIVDIGAAVKIPKLSVRVSTRGVLMSADVSREMLAARAGFFTCPAHCLGKSGIFAAYAAHGLIPVTFNKNRIENGDGLALGEHFISANVLQGREVCLGENISGNIRKWYAGHSLNQQAEIFAFVLIGSTEESQGKSHKHLMPQVS